MKLVKWLGNAGRLLRDVHFSKIKSKRKLVSINLNKDLNETLLNIPKQPEI